MDNSDISIIQDQSTLENTINTQITEKKEDMKKMPTYGFFGLKEDKKKPYNVLINNNKKQRSINPNIKLTDEHKMRIFKTKIEPKLLQKLTVNEDGDIVSQIKKAFGLDKKDENPNEINTNTGLFDVINTNIPNAGDEVQAKINNLTEAFRAYQTAPVIGEQEPEDIMNFYDKKMEDLNLHENDIIEIYKQHGMTDQQAEEAYADEVYSAFNQYQYLSDKFDDLSLVYERRKQEKIVEKKQQMTRDLFKAFNLRPSDLDKPINVDEYQKYEGFNLDVFGDKGNEIVPQFQEQEQQGDINKDIQQPIDTGLMKFYNDAEIEKELQERRTAALSLKARVQAIKVRNQYQEVLTNANLPNQYVYGTKKEKAKARDQSMRSNFVMNEDATKLEELPPEYRYNLNIGKRVPADTNINLERYVNEGKVGAPFLPKTIEAKGQAIKRLYHKTTTKVEKAKQELVERRKTAKFTTTEYDEILKKKRGDLFP